MGFWQGITGGGEDNEKPIETAKREAYEEGSIPKESNYIELSSLATIPAANIRGFLWGDGIIMIPEFTFGVELASADIKIGEEHTEYRWFSFKNATEQLKYDSNKLALWELNHRLENRKIDGIEENKKIIKKYL